MESYFPLLLLLLLLTADASTIDSQNARLAVELAADLPLHRSAGEPPFSAAIAAAGCTVDRVLNTGFTVVLPGFVRGQKSHADWVHTNATRVDDNTMICHVPKLITTGNTSVIAAAAAGNYSAAYFHSFTLFSPAWGLRPYVRETNGSVVTQLDEALLHTPEDLSICVQLAGQGAKCALNLALPPAPRRAYLQLPFALNALGLPRNVSILTTLALTFPAAAVAAIQRGGAAAATSLVAMHPRVFARAAPPSTAAKGTRVWQVDHAAPGGVLRVDGTPFIANGWFGGAYDHESAGIPPRLQVPLPGTHNWTRSTYDPTRPISNSSGGGASQITPLESWTYTQRALGQSSRMAEWARHGLSFLRTGLGWKPRDERLRPDGKIDVRWFPDWADVILGLDAAAAAGIPILLNIGVDTLALANASHTNASTSANTDLSNCGDDESNVDASNPPSLCAWIREAVKRVRNHPGLGGYYGCDDCCHVGTTEATHHREYNAIAAIKAAIFKLDPYHLVYGTIACGATWLWQEEGTGLGLDVVMKESYGSGVGSCGNGDTPRRDADDALCKGIFRSHPMTFEPFQNMPAPGAIRAPTAVRSHAYAGVVQQQSHSNNFYVYNNGEANTWPLNQPVLTFASEISEIGSSIIDPANLFALPPGATHGPQLRARAVSGGAANADVLVMARWWSEGDSDSLCEHVVIVNMRPRPLMTRVAAFSLPPRVRTALQAAPGKSLTLERIFGGGGGGTCPTCAEPSALYAVNLTAITPSAAGADEADAAFIDFIDGQGTNVYRMGCTPENAPAAAAVSVVNGGFEDVNVATPTIVSQGLSGLGGRSASWTLTRGVFNDDRARLRVSTALPRSGRHCAEVNLASGAELNMTVPLDWSSITTSGSESAAMLTAWVRGSPDGASIVVRQSAAKAVAVMGVEWMKTSWPITLGVNATATTPIVLSLRGPTSNGGVVFLDDITLEMSDELLLL